MKLYSPHPRLLMSSLTSQTQKSDTAILSNDADYPYPTGDLVNESNSKIMKFIIKKDTELCFKDFGDKVLKWITLNYSILKVKDAFPKASFPSAVGSSLAVRSIFFVQVGSRFKQFAGLIYKTKFMSISKFSMTRVWCKFWAYYFWIVIGCSLHRPGGWRIHNFMDLFLTASLPFSICRLCEYQFHLNSHLPSFFGFVQCTRLPSLRVWGGSMYAVLSSHVKRLFPWFEHVTSKSQWSNIYKLIILTCGDRVLRNNQLEGILDIGTSYSNQLRLIDLQKNLITGFTHSAEFNITIILLGNPICEGGGVPDGYCRVLQSNSSYSTPQNNCVPAVCLSDQSSSPNCKCACPYAGTLVFVAPSFSDLDNSSYYITLEESLMHSFRTHDLPVDSVSLSNPTKNSFDYLELSLEVFPSGQNRFNRTGISMLGFTLSSRTFNPPRSFGLFYFLADEYTTFAEVAISTTPSIVIIIGAVAGGSVLVLFLFLAGVYAFCQKRKARATNNTPFAFWNPNTSSGGIPQLQGARCFSFEELKECTNNFSEANSLGSGGYGKVYRGDLPSGQLVAIKRAQQGSMQSGVQFKTEIELLSRVHHKNIVSLVGFCFEQGEEMLIYEYVPNGTLMESLSGKSGIRLDWMRRLKVALGTGRGLAYLHEHANPPIIHRDIKSTNILLDEGLNAKVADFGLTKLMADDGKGHVVTQVKGTMGYLDPEYYETQELTSKSDVYSFGVVMLELISAKRPIERGRFIVREMREATEVYEILDPAIGFGTTPKGIERFVNLAMACVQESGAVRPTMGEVVKEIESIMQMAGLNPNDVESESYNEEATFDYSGVFPLSKIEPQ